MPPRKRQRALPAADTSAAAAASAVAQPQPPHTRLHVDALEAIFDFLSFNELRSAMLVCQSWLDAVYLMRGLTAGKHLASHTDLPLLFASRLARHVRRFANMYCYQLTHVQLSQAIHSMPFLQTLSIGAMPHADWARSLRGLQLPTTLRDVSIHFAEGFATASANLILKLLGQHEPLQKLRLWFSHLSSAVSFAPLREATQLQTFSIGGVSTALQLTPQHLQQIRPLPISELALPGCSTAALLSLLQMEGPPLRWTKVPTRASVVDDAVAALLPTLVHLHELRSECFDSEALSSFDFLADLPTLHTLCLDFPAESQPPVDRLTTMLAAMRYPLAQLTSFTLEGLPLDDAQLESLLTLMPQLDSLNLGWMDSFNSLTFLAPVAATLRTLRVSFCQHPDLTPIKLRYLQELPQLTELDLDRSMSELLDTLSVDLLTPPSQLLPTLQSFTYDPPELDF